jgi:hypothetical protein
MSLVHFNKHLIGYRIVREFGVLMRIGIFQVGGKMNTQKAVLGLCLGAVVFGCQSQSSQPPAKKQGANPYPSYTPDPYANGGLGGNGAFGSGSGSLTIESRSGSTLTAYVGSEAYWVFTARFSGTASSPIQLNATVNPQPPNMTIIGQGSDTINIRWTPQPTDATTYQSGSVNITASGPGNANQSFSWTMNNNGGGGGFGGLGGGGGGGGLLAMLPAVIQTISSGGDIGDLFQRLLQGFGSGGGGTNPFGGLGGQGGAGGLGAGGLGAGGFGGVGGNAGNNFGNFNNNYGQPGAGQGGNAGQTGNAGGQGGFGGGGGGW